MAAPEVGPRGEYARSPLAMPWRAWREIALRVKDEVGRDRVSVIAAGVAFYGFLALYPAMIALVLLYGLLFSPFDVHAQLDPYAWLLPQSVFQLISGQLTHLAEKSNSSLSLGLIFSILLALWSSTKGITALMAALNLAYEERERRGLFVRNLVAVALTVGALIFFMLSLALIAAIPAAIAFLPVPASVATVLGWVRWVVLAVLVVVALALLYGIAPSRNPAKVRWVSVGAVVACVLWLVVSLGFSFYVQSFGSYDKVFGSVAAVVVLLMWLYLTAFAVLVGAEINAELEMQTHIDSTMGPPRPEGERRAYVADHTRPPPPTN